MIGHAHAIVDPRTVMVKSLNTLVADTAVARAICSNDLTVGAQQDWVKDLHHLHEIDPARAFEVPRVLAHGHRVQDQSQSEQG